jgi:hypothetical protein
MKFNEIKEFIKYCPIKTRILLLTKDHEILIIKNDINNFTYYDNIDSKIIPLDLVLDFLLGITVKRLIC